tara:strand:- start:151 stop:303 length:153 start_codon:yes stop_codon:yes gene_type:complete
MSEEMKIRNYLEEDDDEGDCDQAVEEAIEARNHEWASIQTEIDEAGYGCI